MKNSKIPYHLGILFFLLVGILTLSGTRVRTELIHDPRPRFLSLFTSVPKGYVKVLDDVDGDTIKVLVNGKEETVRFLGVDTPETKDPRKGVQCFGHIASEFTKNMVMGKAVRLVRDEANSDRDAFGRLLRYVILPNGSNLNAHLVSGGYAFAYEKFQASETKHFEQLEADAREHKRGLWGSCQVSIKNDGKQKSTQTVEE
jgi:micrococcal nuclease